MNKKQTNTSSLLNMLQEATGMEEAGKKPLKKAQPKTSNPKAKRVAEKILNMAVEEEGSIEGPIKDSEASGYIDNYASELGPETTKALNNSDFWYQVHDEITKLVDAGNYSDNQGSSEDDTHSLDWHGINDLMATTNQKGRSMMIKGMNSVAESAISQGANPKAVEEYLKKLSSSIVRRAKEGQAGL